MKRIELIGPSGGGKSYLVSFLKKNRGSYYDWSTYDEAILEIVKQKGIRDIKGLSKKVYGLLLQLGVEKGFVIKKLLPKLKVQKSISDEFNYFAELHFNYLSNDLLYSNYLQKLYYCQFHYSVLQSLNQLLSLNYQGTVLFDEGPFATCYGLQNGELNRLKKSAILPQVVFYCYLSPEENFKRLLKRKEKNGRIGGRYSALEKEKDIMKLIKIIHEEKSQQRDLLASLNIPIIDVNLEEIITPKKAKELNKLLSNKF